MDARHMNRVDYEPRKSKKKVGKTKASLDQDLSKNNT